jgi:hypothetical protein
MNGHRQPPSNRASSHPEASKGRDVVFNQIGEGEGGCIRRALKAASSH